MAIGGQDITQEQTWALLLYAYKPGDSAELTVQRLQNDTWVKGTVNITFDQTPEEVFANCQIGS